MKCIQHLHKMTYKYAKTTVVAPYNVHIRCCDVHVAKNHKKTLKSTKQHQKAPKSAKSKAPKSTKKHRKAPKSTKKHQERDKN